MDKRIEVNRKLIHIGAGFVLVALLFFRMLNGIILGIFTLFMFTLFALSRKSDFLVVKWYLHTFERTSVRKRFPGKGLIFYLVGVTFTVLLFSRDIAMAAILILAIGDSVSGFVGSFFRRIRHPFSDKKFLEGAAAGIFLSFLAAQFFVRWYEALAAAIVALLVEGIDMKIGMEKIDDNMIIPLVAGAVIWLIRAAGI